MYFLWPCFVYNIVVFLTLPVKEGECTVCLLIIVFKDLQIQIKQKFATKAKIPLQFGIYHKLEMEGINKPLNNPMHPNCN